MKFTNVSMPKLFTLALKVSDIYLFRRTEERTNLVFVSSRIIMKKPKEIEMNLTLSLSSHSFAWCNMLRSVGNMWQLLWLRRRQQLHPQPQISMLWQLILTNLSKVYHLLMIMTALSASQSQSWRGGAGRGGNLHNLWPGNRISANNWLWGYQLN